ncbi:DUF262 domain-containing protein [Thermomonas mangrovi]|uniref:DUF262 domain-containing protein n=1 Tax=Thermomonas mangrovi TaxID=2993316 RepID=UPI002307C846|nr:DUF262 domain-containing protein [Thermomonas mangrovi]
MKSEVIGRFRDAQNSLVVQASDLSLASITEMVFAQAIDLNPHYQRRERWGPEKQSLLIESFLLNVPVPPLYLAEEDYGHYSVIDGKQRITAVHDFVSGRLKLRGLERFPEINGASFADLPFELQNTLKVRPFLRVVTLLRQSDPTLKYEVFLRLNTGGDRLLPQEVRNVAYSGPFNDLLIRLAENEFLREKLKIEGAKSPAFMAMADVEHVLRFLTTLNWWRNMGGSLATQMDEFMRANRNISPGEAEAFEEAFTTAIQSCESIWGTHAFERPLGANTWRNQMISPLYDAQMVSVSVLNDQERAIAVQRRDQILEGTRELFANEDFAKSVTRATNNAGSIRFRVSAFIEFLSEVVR